MKKFQYFRFGVLLLIAGCMYSCVKDEMPAPNQPKTLPSITLAEARGYFDAVAPTHRTRSDASSSDFETFFTLGDFNPDWTQGAISEHPDLASADIPAPSQYFYGVVYGEGDAARAYVINHDLLVVKDRTEKLTPACYLRFFVPDSTCIEVYTAEVCASLLHSDTKATFSGVAIYTTLDGMPVGVDSYIGGCPVDGVFLGDTTLLWEARCEKLLAMMPDVLFLRCRKGVETRIGIPEGQINWREFNVNTNSIDSNPCEIFGTRIWPNHIKNWGTESDGQTPPKDPILNNIVGSGGGPSGPTTPGKINIKYSDKIVVSDPKLRNLLDSLRRDCLGKNLVESLPNNITISFGSSSQHSKQTFYQDGKVFAIDEAIRLKTGENRPFVLMEELIHVYQGELSNSESRKLNDEIEAKIGWVLYLRRLGENIDSHTSGFGVDIGPEDFSFLADSYRDGANVNDPLFREHYQNAAQGLRTLPAYSSTKNYPLANDYNLNMLKKLMKDC